jgi:hypothetical protein
MIRGYYTILLLLLSVGNIFSNPALGFFTPIDYIDEYKEVALREMQRFSVPASITLGQAILESKYGNSDLAKNANNHFGIKCHKEWTGPTYTMDDDESDECFRKYENVLESYADHSMFLSSRVRYAALFQLSKKDYKAWAKGLKEAGYATHPKYAEMLIEIIEKYKLYEFDEVYFDPSFYLAEDKKRKLLNEAALSFNQKYFLVYNENASPLSESENSFVSVVQEFNSSTQEFLKFKMLYLDEKHCLAETKPEEIAVAVISNKKIFFLLNDNEIKNTFRAKNSTLKNDLLDYSHLEMDYPHLQALLFPSRRE